MHPLMLTATACGPGRMLTNAAINACSVLASNVTLPRGSIARISSPAAFSGSQSIGSTDNGFRKIIRPAINTLVRAMAAAYTKSGSTSSPDRIKCVADVHAIKPATSRRRRSRSLMAFGSGTKIVHAPSDPNTSNRGTTSSRDSTMATENCNSFSTASRITCAQSGAPGAR